jgi:uncharacterized protein
MLEDTIYKEYFDALKSKNKDKADFLSFIRAEIKNSAITAKKDKLEDGEVLAVLKKIKKNLDEAKETFSTSTRTDLVEKAQREIAILDVYLPKSLSEAELTVIVGEAVSSLGATSIKDMGKVMKEVIGKVGVRADSKMVSDLVKKRLTQPA